MVVSKLHGRAIVSLPAFALAAWSLLATPSAAAARSAGVKVLVDATVSDQARATMSPELWTKYVSDYAGGTAIAFAGPGVPTLDDCRKAGADYMLVAPFELRPRLPGIANASGRVAASTHLLATNCITGEPSLDQTLQFDSDPPVGTGDFESVPENTWAHAIPATFARNAVTFERMSRLFSINAPFALVEIKGAGQLHVGDPLRDFSTPDHKPRDMPIMLTITQLFDNYVEVTDAQSAHPQDGDLVEPLVKPKDAKPL